MLESLILGLLLIVFETTNIENSNDQFKVSNYQLKPALNSNYELNINHKNYRKNRFKIKKKEFKTSKKNATKRFRYKKR